MDAGIVDFPATVPEKLYTLKEALQYWGIGRTTFYRLRNKGAIRCGSLLGSTWRFTRADLLSVLERAA